MNEGAFVMDKMDIITNMKNSTLFRALEDEVIFHLAENAVSYIFEKGERVVLNDGISLICSGSFGAYSSETNKSRLLNKLSRSDCFGFASLYCAECNSITQIKATAKGEIVFFPRTEIEYAAGADGSFALAIIKILSEKIRFLSSKIDSYLSVSADEKLYKYLKKCDTDECGFIVLSEKMTVVADRLGIGRASLYRAFASLEENEKISKQDNRYKLL